jgi:tetratricopeptide (TPR) repeat protein
MLETLRAYARERLDDLGESDGWRRRHGEYFAQLAEEIGPGLLGADELAWRARFVSELDNLRAAVVWALDSTASADHELAMRIVASLAAQTNFWRAGGVGALAERALPYVAATTPGRRAMILAAAAFSQYFRGDLDGARVLALDAVSEGTPPDSSFPALPFIALCSIYAAAGEHARGVAVIDDALATYPVFEHDDSARVFAAGSACIFEAFGGAFLEARARYEEVLPLTRSLRNPTLLAGALAGAGLLFADTEPDRAIAALDESIALTRAGAGNIAFELALTQRAQLHARAGNRSEALDALRDAVQHARDVGHRTMLTLLMTSTVQILTMIGSDETDEAAVVISSALATGDLRYLVIGIIDQQHDQLSKVVARLGDHRYEAARVRGAGLTFDDLIHYAVAEMDNALARDAQHDA